MGFEPHSVAGSALKLASRLPLRGARSGWLTISPASAGLTLVIPRVAYPRVFPHEGSTLPSKPSVVDSNLLNVDWPEEKVTRGAYPVAENE